jgi:predicted DsbA family dithiol-disulfide isomerase
LRIDVIFDSVCPWCYIGKRRLEKALALRPGLDPDIAWRPFLLNPEMPPDGIERTLYLVRKFGSEARVRRVYGAIAEAGLSEEIDFAFDSIRQTPNSVDSHRLVRFSGPAAGDAVEALFQAYFLRGENIGERDVLVGIGTGIGLDERTFRAYLESDADIDDVLAENARAHRFGITGVPAYVIDGEMVISGAQDPAILARVMDVARTGAA